ncbi:hypothetical protein CDD82_4286 [Ophiocordyceps australis]|uniref:Uncharacterized protein n=1 Tax=Ophiocordyceps australis TaxID=1399860 RepID=A0A2C5Z424_9HYPO|nr:hypothetical protein CDD82_4286 [Ophiocordyceps australis]
MQIKSRRRVVFTAPYASAVQSTRYPALRIQRGLVGADALALAQRRGRTKGARGQSETAHPTIATAAPCQTSALATKPHACSLYATTEINGSLAPASPATS